MKVKDVVINKEYDRIEYRTKPVIEDQVYDIFCGCCSYINGELKSLDGDNYSLETEIISFEEWQNENENIKNGLTIYV